MEKFKTQTLTTLLIQVLKNEKKYVFLIIVLLLCSCSSSKLCYNSKELDWSNRQLKTLPYDELLKYKYLEKINLSDNNLTTFPDSLYLLSNLKVLLLSRNNIGILPNSVNKFSSLTTLDLFGNAIIEFPNMENMNELNTLRLEVNSIDFLKRLSCSIPKKAAIIYNYELRPYTKKDCNRPD